MNAPKPYYPALTGLRAVAAYLVFFCHNAPDRIDWRWLPMQSWLSRFMEEWGVGVSIFFVLSGFLIATRYQVQATPTRAWWGTYLRNRFARIYPLYALLTLLAFGVAAWHTPWASAAPGTGQKMALQLVLNLTLLRGFFEQHIFSGVMQGWSLTAEECFYLAAPMLLIGARANAWRLLLYAAGLLGTGFLLVGVGQLVKNVPVLGSGGFISSVPFMLGYTFFGRCAEFLAGMGLALYVTRRPPPAASCSQPGPFTLLGVGWIIVGTALTATLRSTLPFSEMTKYHFCLPIYNFVLPVGIVLLLYGLVYERSWLRSVLETRLFDLLGRSSYAFYLLHLGFISSCISVFMIGHPPIKLVELIIVSIIVYWWIEEPLRKRIAQRSR
ncbi:acyltransferase family protein [Hymenobacter glacialis]|uniref:Acyltransferase 3 domain-containing protein n=1 Tax=Hymenobacter glacialis TaxID=1908236 RepID=A0A1G1T444_9BACT|nr:acyltransferase [Hymenobacter glacialis]OGX85639.1 hypothetical protein BEN48_02075 [Hymenobacter glacialis]